jgi:REP element-mobilizing transposase RayT
MQLNEAGRMIRSVWDEIAVFYPGVETDEFVVMPDHIHGVRAGCKIPKRADMKFPILPQSVRFSRRISTAWILLEDHHAYCGGSVRDQRFVS